MLRAVLVDSTPHPVFTCDHESRIVGLNPAAERAFGFARAELTGRLLTDIVRGESDGETTATRADGTTFPAELVLARAELPSRSLVVAHVRDVSAERALTDSARQLERSQRLETIGLVVAGIAHDFNNLLGVIHGYSELMLASEIDDVDRNDARELQHAARRAVALAREMLAFCRRQRLEPRSLDLNALVDGMRPLLSQLLGDHVELETNLGAELSRVFADPGALERVLVNLAVNARQAMPRGRGRLTVSTANVDLVEGAFVSLVVADDGVGMDDATRARLFEPFFTTKGGKGHGLGLASVHAAVAASGGRISVATAPGEGARFTILLPREGAN